MTAFRDILRFRAFLLRALLRLEVIKRLCMKNKIISITHAMRIVSVKTLFIYIVLYKNNDNRLFKVCYNYFYIIQYK